MAPIENKMRNLLEQIASEQGYKKYKLNITPVSSDGGNYTSVLYKAKVEEDNKSNLNMFIKIAIIGDATRESMDIKAYEAERYVYKTMRRIFTEIEDRHNVKQEDRLVMPKYYGCHIVVKEEMLVLEDLTASGYTVYDRNTSVDWPYASAALRQLAKFHALAMVFQKDYPEEYKMYCQDFFTEIFSEENYNTIFKGGCDKALDVVRDDNRDKLRNFFNKTSLETILDMEKPIRKPVLTHTDYRPSNLMHKYKEDGSVELIPVDYQTMREGCVVVDLLYFIFNGTDEKFRKQYYQKMIDHYFTELSAAMNRLGLDSSFYSRDDFKFELKQKLPYGLVVAAFSLPIVTVDSEDAPKIEEGLELTALNNVKTSKLFIERLNGIVNDYVRWGILV